jgi:hypothetical protein
MFDQSRHYPLKNIKWELELVQQAIQDISDDAIINLIKAANYLVIRWTTTEYVVIYTWGRRVSSGRSHTSTEFKP